MQVDGEVVEVGATTPVRIEIAPGALSTVR
jgi:hypothetical protein